jgi:prolipoprotein diacylglyceryltransferase/protein-S-isoprenylcysteine O-methyltransferase Ste14
VRCKTRAAAAQHKYIYAVIARLLYTATFVVLLPALLVAWGARLDALLTLPAYGSPLVGWPIASAGVALMLAATRSLWVVGQGLPASPFPPKHFVTRGIYGIVAHPIYLGAIITAIGVSLATNSGAGLWIVTPVLTLACAAWVIGFERDATIARFGPQPAPLLSLPPATNDKPLVRERFVFQVVVLAPWLTAFMAVELLGAGSDGISTFMAWDAALPVIPWTESIYFSTYVIATLAPFIVRTRRELRDLSLDALWATALIMPLYLALPLVAVAKPVEGQGFWEWMLRFERQGDSPTTAIPSFHIVWACIAARVWAQRFPRWRWPLALLVAATAVACVTTGMHSALDIIGGGVAYVVVIRRGAIWEALCSAAEAIANSWREARVGPVRLLSHGVYNAVGIAVSVAIAVALAGSEHLWWLIAMTLTGVIGAGVWAQLVEGSPQLLRPYGYFGSVVAMPAFAVAMSAFGGDGWLVLVALTTGTAFGQPIGRLRCLVQGCCHGRRAEGVPGICYTHPMSRVARLSSLGGVPVHPTPLYSIVWTLLVGALLLRLWSLQAPLSFIGGAYLILIGAGRFVEEHFRGEPQTRVVGGLRVYQWLAIAMIVVGAVVTCIATPNAPSFAGFDAATLLPLLGLLLASYFAYGVDFPDSSRRFSRLA